MPYIFLFKVSVNVCVTITVVQTSSQFFSFGFMVLYSWVSCFACLLICYHIWNVCNRTIGLSLKFFQVGLDQKHGEVLSTYQDIVKLWHHQFLCHLQPIAQCCVLFLGVLLLIHGGNRTWVWISMCRDMIQYWRRFLTQMLKRLGQRHTCVLLVSIVLMLVCAHGIGICDNDSRRMELSEVIHAAHASNGIGGVRVSFHVAHLPLFLENSGWVGFSCP